MLIMETWRVYRPIWLSRFASLDEEQDPDPDPDSYQSHQCFGSATLVGGGGATYGRQRGKRTLD